MRKRPIAGEEAHRVLRVPFLIFLRSVEWGQQSSLHVQALKQVAKSCDGEVGHFLRLEEVGQL